MLFCVKLQGTFGGKRKTKKKKRKKKKKRDPNTLWIGLFSASAILDAVGCVIATHRMTWPRGRCRSLPRGRWDPRRQTSQGLGSGRRLQSNTSASGTGETHCGWAGDRHRWESARQTRRHKQTQTLSGTPLLNVWTIK